MPTRKPRDKPKTTIAILDGDVFCYQAALRVQKPILWPNRIYTLHACLDSAECAIDSHIDKVKKDLAADEVIIALSDTDNFRKDILPSYKAHRGDTLKPLCLFSLRDYLVQQHHAVILPKLEGDDVMGIMATSPKLKQRADRLIMVTIDKDLKTVAGLHYNLNKPQQGVFKVSEKEAELFHLTQALAGDPTDGYSGCPSMGMQTAKEFLEAQVKFTQEKRTLKSGPNKGKEQTRWVKVPCEDMWEAIVSAYEKQGLTEQDALIQAQVARICQYENWDKENREVRLWNPK